MKIKMKSDLLKEPIDVVIDKIVNNTVFVRNRGVFSLNDIGRLTRTIELNDQKITEMLIRPDLENNPIFGASGLTILTQLFYTFTVGEPVYWDIAGVFLSGRVVQMKGKRVQVQQDKIVKDSTDGSLSSQPDPQGRVHAFSLRKSGVWRMAHITDHKSSLYRGSIYD